MKQASTPTEIGATDKKPPTAVIVLSAGKVNAPAPLEELARYIEERADQADDTTEQSRLTGVAARLRERADT
jgi:hypothetical protein